MVARHLWFTMPGEFHHLRPLTVATASRLMHSLRGCDIQFAGAPTYEGFCAYFRPLFRTSDKDRSSFLPGYYDKRVIDEAATHRWLQLVERYLSELSVAVRNLDPRVRGLLSTSQDVCLTLPQRHHCDFYFCRRVQEMVLLATIFYAAAVDTISDSGLYEDPPHAINFALLAIRMVNAVSPVKAKAYKECRVPDHIARSIRGFEKRIYAMYTRLFVQKASVLKPAPIEVARALDPVEPDADGTHVNAILCTIHNGWQALQGSSDPEVQKAVRELAALIDGEEAAPEASAIQIAPEAAHRIPTAKCTILPDAKDYRQRSLLDEVLAMNNDS